MRLSPTEVATVKALLEHQIDHLTPMLGRVPTEAREDFASALANLQALLHRADRSYDRFIAKCRGGRA